MHLVRPAKGDRVFAVLPGSTQKGEAASILQIQ
jgi:hypothetical protein